MKLPAPILAMILAVSLAGIAEQATPQPADKANKQMSGKPQGADRHENWGWLGLLGLGGLAGLHRRDEISV
jgi:MYXO-CTERM domain-containing protein